jgi:hypothetical protein
LEHRGERLGKAFSEFLIRRTDVDTGPGIRQPRDNIPLIVSDRCYD